MKAKPESSSPAPQGEKCGTLDADQPREKLLGQSLRERAHQLRRQACSAWSDVVIPPYAGLDQAKCELAAALEDRLRNVIDELADQRIGTGQQPAEAVGEAGEK